MKNQSNGLLLAFTLVSLPLISSLAIAEPARPNVLLIYADDQGYGDASCLNPEAKFKTPNLDRLAKEGLAFTNAHCADTVCTPSRYGLLTGRYCWRTSRKTGVMGAEGPCLIAPGRVTLASLLKERGYQTAMVGKWHLGMQMPGSFGERDWSQPVRDMPLDRGFQYFYGIPASLNYGVLAWFEGRYAKTPPLYYTGKKPNRRHVDYRIMPPYQNTPREVRQAIATKRLQVIEVAEDFVDDQCLTRFTDRAIGWIREHEANSESPFFLYLPLTSPHYPVCPKPEFHGQGECGGYGEFMIETDHHVGRLLACLDDLNIAKDTLVIYTSDNGPERSYRERATTFGHRSNGPFQGGKRDIYEGGHRVPMFWRWPAGIDRPGRQAESLVGQTDVLATIADLVGAKTPADAAEDSQSFAGLLRDASADHQRPPLVNHGANGRFAVTDGDWKLIMPHRKLNYELYNLRDDPQETTNLAGRESVRVKQLERQLSRIVARGRTNVGPVQANDTKHWSDLAWMTAAEYDAIQAGSDGN